MKQVPTSIDGLDKMLNSYWWNYGKIYFKKFRGHNIFNRIRYRQQEKELIRCLGEETFADDNDISTVLEVGCGFGRITKILLNDFNVEKIEAFDLSPHQIENAKRYTKRYVMANRASFKVCNIFDYPFHPESFDLVIAIEVLMHIPPPRIEYVIQKVCEAAKKYVVSLDAMWYSGRLAPHCFNHDYTNLYSKAIKGKGTINCFKPKDSVIASLFKSVQLRQHLYIIEKTA